MVNDRLTWEELPPFDAEIAPESQVLIIAGTGGSKSTLAASLLLDTDSLIAIDSKASLTLPRAAVVELPVFPDHRPGWMPSGEGLDAYDRAIRDAIRRPERPPRISFGRRAPASGRVVIRPAAQDVDDAQAHERLFAAIYAQRLDTVVWIDEITGTGNTSQGVTRSLKALSARGRTRGQGIWTLTQAAYGLVPVILRRNAHLVILGSLDRRDVRELPYDGAEIAADITRQSGRFIVYRAGDSQPYRLYVPIPPALRRWTAP